MQGLEVGQALSKPLLGHSNIVSDMGITDDFVSEAVGDMKLTALSWTVESWGIDELQLCMKLKRFESPVLSLLLLICWLDLLIKQSQNLPRIGHLSKNRKFVTAALT